MYPQIIGAYTYVFGRRAHMWIDSPRVIGNLFFCHKVLGVSALSFKGDKVLQELSTLRFWFKEGYLVVKFDRFEQGFRQRVFFDLFVQGFSVGVLLSSRILSTSLLLRFLNDKVAAGGYIQVKVLEFFDCLGLRQGVEDLRELLHKVLCLIRCCEVYITRIKSTIRVTSKSVGYFLESRFVDLIGWSDFQGVHGVHDKKRVWFEVELQGAQEDREAEVFQEEKYHTGWKIKTGNVLDFCNKSYREDSNEAAFAVAVVDKIYAHESLTFNNTFACGVISKWKDGLQDDMDARSDVYVLSNGCRKCSDGGDGYCWEYTPGLLDKTKGNVLGMEIVRDQSGNTLRVSQSRFYNGKLIQTLLEGHSILLEGSLSGDCDVEKNGKWSCIYAMGSQEYQMSCMILNIASADVGMLDKFDRGLQTDVQVFVDFDYAMGRSIILIGKAVTIATTITGATIWATKGLLDKVKGNVLGMEIVKDQSDTTLRVSRSRFHNEKLVQTLLKGTPNCRWMIVYQRTVMRKRVVSGHIYSWKPGVSSGLHET
nr:zinc finger, CCHC-type [Tanacetum cinerariifolium]